MADRENRVALMLGFLRSNGVPRRNPDLSPCRTAEETEWVQLGGNVEILRLIRADDERVSFAAVEEHLRLVSLDAITSHRSKISRGEVGKPEIPSEVVSLTAGESSLSVRKARRFVRALQARKEYGARRPDPDGALKGCTNGEEAEYVRYFGTLDEIKVLSGDDEEAADRLLAEILLKSPKGGSTDGRLLSMGLDPRLKDASNATEARAALSAAGANAPPGMSSEEAAVLRRLGLDPEYARVTNEHEAREVRAKTRNR